MQDLELSPDEQILLDNFRSLSDTGKKLLLSSSEIYARNLNKDIISFPTQNHVL